MPCVLCQNKHLISYQSKQPIMWDKVHRKKDNKKKQKNTKEKKNQNPTLLSCTTRIALVHLVLYCV